MFASRHRCLHSWYRTMRFLTLSVTLCVVAIFMLEIAIAISAFSPSPGAKMRLMGLSVLALPAVVAASALLTLLYCSGVQWTHRISIVLASIGWSTLIIQLPLLLLG